MLPRASRTRIDGTCVVATAAPAPKRTVGLGQTTSHGRCPTAAVHLATTSNPPIETIDEDVSSGRHRILGVVLAGTEHDPDRATERPQHPACRGVAVPPR